MTVRKLKPRPHRRIGPKAVEVLRTRLRDAEELLRAFNNDEIDAIIRSSPAGQQVYTLRGTDHAYRMIVETMSEGALTLSPDGVILYANRRFADLLAADLENVMGHRVQEFLDPAFSAVVEDWLHRSEALPTRGAIRLLRPNAESISVYLAMRPLTVDETLCLIAIVTDLSELERSEIELRRADEQVRVAIEAAPTGMLLMDLSSSIVLVNAQIETQFGYPRADLLGKPIGMLVHNLGSGGEVVGHRKDGTQVRIEVAFTPLHTTRGELVLVSVVDLSARLEMDRMRTDFVSTISHELRTPLTSITGSLGLVQSGAMGALPEKAAAMVRIAYENSGRLVRIINDILDIGALEAGQFTIQTSNLDLLELLHQSVQVSAGYATLCQTRFVIEPFGGEVMVAADPHRLVQVVANLLSNAAKFSPPDTDVIIRVRPQPMSIRVEVENAGPAIAMEFQGRLFEKFAQADASASRQFGGSGLGLSIARRLIEAMGGSVGFTTAAGITVFYLEIPKGMGIRSPPQSDARAALH